VVSDPGTSNQPRQGVTHRIDCHLRAKLFLRGMPPNASINWSAEIDRHSSSDWPVIISSGPNRLQSRNRSQTLERCRATVAPSF